MPFQKGHKLSGSRKGKKNKKTIFREQARKIFEEIQLKKWVDISEKTLERALEDSKVREYVINQVIGKPKESVGLSGDAEPVRIDLEFKKALDKIYGNESKNKKTGT